jgi:RNA polymerase sigma-70 factor, ECF subfamily
MVSSVGAAQSAGSEGGTMGVSQGVEAVDRVGVAPLFASPHGGVDDEVAQRRTRRAIARVVEDGDREALRDLYLRYSGLVYRHVRAVIRDEHEAQDITQLVFLKLIAALRGYDPGHGPFRPWLLRVARNLAIDEIRRRRAVPAGQLPDGPSDETSRLRATALYDALAALSADQREVLVLRQMVGLLPAEIAERMDRTEGSVHALHHRARAAMRASLVSLEAAPSTAGGRAR